jgi:hypothetical protein
MYIIYKLPPSLLQVIPQEATNGRNKDVKKKIRVLKAHLMVARILEMMNKLYKGR